jgi:large subunit ribosomal protein L7/L12
MIVVGNKWKWEDLASVSTPCPTCGKSPTTLCFGRNRATVYWIPIFSFKEAYALFCQACDSHYGVEEPQAKALLAGAAQAAATQATSAPAAPAEAQGELDVVLTDVGGTKVQVIKEVQSLTELGLAAVTDLVEGAPRTVLQSASKEDAEKAKLQLESVGATVELRPSVVGKLDPMASAAPPLAAPAGAEEGGAAGSSSACADCGQALPSAARFCPSCGREQVARPTVCPSCGAEAVGRFCAECGTPVGTVGDSDWLAPGSSSRGPA